MLSSKDHTFVICAYKENPYLESTIQSILRQKRLGDVLISTSTPNAHIEGIAKKYGVPLYVNPHAHMAGDDWNYGYDKACTNLITLAHQDDIYEPNYLEKVLEAANSYDPSELSMIFTDYYEIREGINVLNNRLLKIKEIMNLPFKYKYLNSSKLIKRRVLSFGNSICCPAVTYAKFNLGNGIFDTTFKNSCDYKTFVDLASIEGRFIYVPDKAMGHRIYAESATSLNLAENIRKKEDQEILETLWPKPIAKLVNSVYSKSEKSNEL